MNHNLNDLLVNLAGRDLISARDINDAGRIVGFGVPPDGVRLRGFLLVPVCDTDFNGDGAVDTIDVLAFLNAWAAGC